MWGGGGSEWGLSWVGVNGEVCKMEWLGGLAFIWRGVQMLVKVSKDEHRD